MDEFERSLNDVLVNTFNHILEYEERSLQSISNSGITIREAHIIEVVGKEGKKVSVSEIASRLRVAVSTVTVAVQKLERKGLVTRAVCKDDGRRSNISLTEMGERIDRAHSVFHRKMVKNISQDFKPEEKEILLNAIHKLNAFFSQKAEVEDAAL